MLKQPATPVLSSSPRTPRFRHVVNSAPPKLTIYARAQLPTRTGLYEIVSFQDETGRGLDDVAILTGDVKHAQGLRTRVHSECLTGDVFLSERCDCREQLELALERIKQEGLGLILYMRQEGRGIGIAAKVGAYALQEKGYDTVDANRHLGFDDDLRTYDYAAGMLNALEVESITLQTNNPAKINGLREFGIKVMGREAIQVEPLEHNATYLDTKRERMGHLLDET